MFSLVVKGGQFYLFCPYKNKKKRVIKNFSDSKPLITLELFSVVLK